MSLATFRIVAEALEIREGTRDFSLTVDVLIRFYSVFLSNCLVISDDEMREV
jgi:hypothetical protein